MSRFGLVGPNELAWYMKLEAAAPDGAAPPTGGDANDFWKEGCDCGIGADCRTGVAVLGLCCALRCSWSSLSTVVMMLFKRDSKLTTFGVSGATLGVAVGVAVAGGIARYCCLVIMIDALLLPTERPVDLITIGAGMRELSPTVPDPDIADAFRLSELSLYL